MHLQEMSLAMLYDRDAEPDEQARLFLAMFADPVIVAAGNINTAFLSL